MAAQHGQRLLAARARADAAQVAGHDLLDHHAPHAALERMAFGSADQPGEVVSGDVDELAKVLQRVLQIIVGNAYAQLRRRVLRVVQIGVFGALGIAHASQVVVDQRAAEQAGGGDQDRQQQAEAVLLHGHAAEVHA